MITVTCGTIPYPFDRIIQWIKAILEQDILEETIYIQYGVADISSIINHPLVKAKSLLPFEEMKAVLVNSRLIIAHAGQGTTRKLVAMNKPFIIVPRRAEYGEHIDNHQLEFAQSVSHQFGIRACNSMIDLKNAILEPPQPINQELFSGPKLADHLLEVFPAENTNHKTSLAYYNRLI